MMITKIQLAAMGRVDIPEEARKDFYLYVDEFQNFATESFANILSEARKYRLDLVLANQYITQIDEKVRDAIFGNAGTIISFRVGALDAEFLEKEFEPIFMQNDIVNLPKYNIYLKLMIDGIAGDAFSATTLPPVYIEDTIENEEKVIAVSRERYASSKAEVEDKISKWAGMMPASGFRTVNGPQGQQKMTAQQIQFQAQAIAKTFIQEETPTHVQNNVKSPLVAKSQEIENSEEADFEEMLTVKSKPMFDAVCDMCGEKIQVPFQPDGKRPTFCKECLKDYQRMTAREKLAQERKIQREQEENNAQYSQTKSAKHELKSRQDYDKQPIQRKVEDRSYAPTEKPLSLSQMRHMAPKKFKTQRTRPNVNLDEVRNLIKGTKNPYVIKSIQNSSKPDLEDDEDYDFDKRETGR
jgi:CxxC-x17-CxxC domain-containing protein